MKQLNKYTANKPVRPEKIIQFGEGNFLRAFVDWIILKLDTNTNFNGSVVVVQPINSGKIDLLNSQDCLYHVNLQGLCDGEKVNSFELIDVISRGINPYNEYDEFIKLAEQPEIRFVISNTTEAGIEFDCSCKISDKPAASYPAKLLQLLYHRYKVFRGDVSKGLIILPCELIFENGKFLRECLYNYIELWELEPSFKKWFEESCLVCSTLVDRIVPGFPFSEIDSIKLKLQYDDNLVVKGEYFHLWVIEAPEKLKYEFPVNEIGLNVLIVPSEQPYHERKVTLLNAPHTVLAPVAFLFGIDIVRDACLHPIIANYLNRVIYDELIQTLDMPRNELISFANNVIERFKNPFIDHQLKSIMLNSFSKFKTRDLPCIKKYLKINGCLPDGLIIGLASIIIYYRGGKRSDGTMIEPNDSAEILSLLNNLWKKENYRGIVEGVMGAKFIWGEDLLIIPGLVDRVTYYIQRIVEKGIENVLKNYLGVDSDE